MAVIRLSARFSLKSSNIINTTNRSVNQSQSGPGPVWGIIFGS
jgi:hypothetical protein